MATSPPFNPHDFWTRAAITCGFALLVPIAYCVYNIYLHPLAKFPGPLLWRITRLPHLIASWRGRLPHVIQNLHRKYGDAVRVAPDELSFANSAAWDDIYSNRGNPAFPKSKTLHGAPANEPSSIFNQTDFDDHARVRRAMTPGFTERAIQRQELILQEYVNLFIHRLSERVVASDSGEETLTINVVEWFNFVMFDIIGDLAFGESFHCLEEVQYHTWMSFMFNSVKYFYLLTTIRHYHLIFNCLMRFIPESVHKKRKEYAAFGAEKLNRRFESNTDRPDIISLIQRRGESGSDNEGLSLGELQANAALLLVAGSETTVTVLTGITNHLLQNSSSLSCLTTEVRKSLLDANDISLTDLKQLPYLNAVINEGLRMCMPTPGGSIRISPPQGGTVAGYSVPGNTYVTINPIALMFSSQHFRDPDSWRPERWLDEAKSPSSPYYNDDRACVRTFGCGPQSCIGISLAWSEMRLILAKVLWTFDLKKANTLNAEVKWEGQKFFGVIDKHPLDAKLVKRAG